MEKERKEQLIGGIINDAEAEINEEMIEKAKEKLKNKLREQKQVQIMLNNIKREIEEIKLEIGHELG